jgi:hypothetical protein
MSEAIRPFVIEKNVHATAKQLDAAPTGQRATFAAAHASMRTGSAGTLGQLEHDLAAAHQPA